jgi:hypothetical protein
MMHSPGAEAHIERLRLFLITWLLGSAGAAGGSIAGHSAGPLGLRVGAVLGGAAGVTLATTFARRVRWLDPRLHVPATAGALVGFACAAFTAVSTLSSPIGPVLSTLMIGLGAIAGATYSARRDAR